MGKGSKFLDEVHLNAFTSKVLSNADSLYRFSYAVLLDHELAYKAVKKVINDSTTQIDAIYHQSESEVSKLLFKDCWQEVDKGTVSSKSTALSEQLSKLTKIKKEQRAAIVLTDFSGFQAKDAAEILGVDLGRVMTDLIEARQALIS